MQQTPFSIRFIAGGRNDPVPTGATKLRQKRQYGKIGTPFMPFFIEIPVRQHLIAFFRVSHFISSFVSAIAMDK